MIADAEFMRCLHDFAGFFVIFQSPKSHRFLSAVQWITCKLLKDPTIDEFGQAFHKGMAWTSKMHHFK